MDEKEKEVSLVKHALWTRPVSLLLALLMILSIPAAAVDVLQDQNTADDTVDAEGTEETLDPFDDSQDTLIPEDDLLASTQTEDGEEGSATGDDAAGQEEDGVNAITQTPEDETAVYVDEDGNYLAPEELIVYITAYADGQAADGSEAEEAYTGVVAFYDYNEEDEEKMLEHPYFFYYEKGVLQSEETCYPNTDCYLNLTQAPTVVSALAADDDTTTTAYQAEEVYVDQEAESHFNYRFVFNLEDVDNGLYTGSLDGVAYVDGLTPAVEITALAQDETSGTKPTITWSKLSDAQSYEVYRRTGSSGSWSKLTTVSASVTTYTDSTATQAGTTYSYQVRAVYADGSRSGDAVSVVDYTYHAIPTATVTSAAGGVTVSWSRDTAATGYRVLRKTSDQQTWTVVGDINEAGTGSKIQWQDTSAVSNTTYTYAVRAYYGTQEGSSREAYTSNVWSGMTASSSVFYLAAPTLTNVFSNSTGMSLYWSKVSGATGYLIYVKPASGGSWTRIGQTDANTLSMTYTNVSVNTSYYFTVRAIQGSVMGPYYDQSNDASTAVTFHGIPTVTLRNGSTFTVSWTKDTTATGYRVFRQEAGTNRWTVVANITSGNTVSYTETTAVNGTKYQYTVRAYYGDVSNLAKDNNYNSNLWSSYKASETTLYVSSPVLGATYSDATGMRTTWTPVSGAVGYIIYRRAAGTTTFTNLGRVSGGSTSYYIDKTVKADVAYSYTVKAIYKDTDGTEYTSGFSYPDEDMVYHVAPTVEVAASSTGNVVYWSLDSKATGYRVYRISASGTTQVLASIAVKDLTTVSGKGRYADDDVTSGTKYTYAVRAYYGTTDIAKASVDTSNQWSGNNQVQMIFLAAPTLSSTTENASTGIKITWTKVTGASGYEVYRRLSTSTSWGSPIATISSGSTVAYLDTTAASGASYYYTVRAVSSTGTRSYYDTTGAYALRIPAPVLKSVLVGTSGTTVTWQSVSGATGYQIWRKKANGSWQLLTTTTSATTLSYVDTEIKDRSTVYYYTVKAYRTVTVDGSKKNIYGAYDMTGMTFGIPMSGSGWVQKNGSTYYVKDGYCLVGWQYLTRNGATYKYYFDTDTGALVTNLYSYFGKSYRSLKCRIVACINSSNSNPSYNTIYLYDSETGSYCIPAVSVRCVGNLTKTTYSNSSKTAYLRAGAGQRWLDSGSYEQYATYISGTYSWFHSALYYYAKSPTNFSSASYNSLVNNNNSTNGCIRMQCIYAFLIQDIMKYGYGKSNRVSVIINKNTSQAGPFGVPKVDKISSRKTDPTDPAVTGKFFYDTSLWGITAKAGASAWTYY